MQLPLAFRSPTLRFTVLGSGSAGNAVVVESEGRRLLVDAGFSCREIERRLARVGASRDGFDGLLLTHEHGDHVRGAARFARRHRVPVYATAGTLEALDLGEDAETRVLRSGEPREIGPFAVEPFGVPHDAREPVGFVVEDAAGGRLGLVADLGTRSCLAWARLSDLDALILETNHDLQMLRDGPYPWPLKERIASRHGHLSNREAAEGVVDLVSDRLRWVVLYHLSRTNNLPALAAEEIGQTLARAGCGAGVRVSAQDEPTEWLDLGVGERRLAAAE